MFDTPVMARRGENRGGGGDEDGKGEEYSAGCRTFAFKKYRGDSFSTN